MEEKEKVFEEKARVLLDYLKKELRHGNAIPRPFFIEITGPPSSGKTTIITELDKFFRKEKFRVLRPQEGAEVIRHVERDTPLYNVRTGIYALTLLIDFMQGHTYDLVIFDRCIFDSYVWMEYWMEKQKLSDEEKYLIQSFFLSRFWVSNIDIAYFVICDPDIAMKRELRIAVSEKMGETSNPATIRTLRDRYVAAYQKLSPYFSQLELIDTTHFTEKEMIDFFVHSTMNALIAKTFRTRP